MHEFLKFLAIAWSIAYKVRNGAAAAADPTDSGTYGESSVYIHWDQLHFVLLFLTWNDGLSFLVYAAHSMSFKWLSIDSIPFYCCIFFILFLKYLLQKIPLKINTHHIYIRTCAFL